MSESHRRDDYIVSRPPLLVQTSNHGFEMETPIFRMPTELISSIFQQLGSDIRSRLILTHTCRRWRRIAANQASLWTNVYIQTRVRRLTARLEDFVAILGMQLDRTANSLLDVEWHTRVDDEFFVATLQLVREKAPFSRWRTLQVHISGGSHDDAPWSTADAFTNLESLTVWYGSDNAIFGVIDRTITSRLKVLNVTWPSSSPTEIVASFAKSVTRVSSLRLHSHQITENMPFLPANLVNLQLVSGQAHPFPHIRTYKVKECRFAGMDTIDLRRMAILIVSEALMVRVNGHVFLPALRELKLGTIVVASGARIEAPALDILHFMRSDGIRNEEEICPDIPLRRGGNGSLLERGYLLSPNTSLIIDLHLRSTTILNLLAKSPKVTHVTLRFGDCDSVQEVLGRLFGLKTGKKSPSAEIATLCPRLSELRLDFSWGVASATTEWVIDGLKAQRKAGFMALLSIYTLWQGEKTYALLTDD